jgi:hypothetical protein
MQTFLKELFLRISQIDGVRLVAAFTETDRTPPVPAAYPAVLVQVVQQTPRLPQRNGLRQAEVTLRLHVLQRALAPSHLPVLQGQQPANAMADAWELPQRLAAALESWSGPAPVAGREYATPLERARLTENNDADGEATIHVLELRTSLIYLP